MSVRFYFAHFRINDGGIKFCFVWFGLVFFYLLVENRIIKIQPLKSRCG